MSINGLHSCGTTASCFMATCLIAKACPIRLNKCALLHLLPALETWLPLEAQESVRMRQAPYKRVTKRRSEACNHQQAAASWHAESERIRSALAHANQQVQEAHANHGTPLSSSCLVMTAWSLLQLVQSVFSCVFPSNQYVTDAAFNQHTADSIQL